MKARPRSLVISWGGHCDIHVCVLTVATKSSILVATGFLNLPLITMVGLAGALSV